MKVDLIVGNARILTCASDGKPLKGAAMAEPRIIEDGAVAIKNGLIAGVGPTAAVASEYETDTFFDAGGRAAAPGFVECHTHIVFAGDRLNEFELKIKGADYLEILKAGGGILSTVRQTRAATVEALIEQTQRRLQKLLSLGVTTCEIKTGYGLDEETEFKMLEVCAGLGKTQPVTVVPTFLAAHAVPKDDFRARYPDIADEEIGDLYTEEICASMIPRLALWRSLNLSDGDPLFVDVFCEKNAFTLEQTRLILETAKLHGFGLKAHVDEFTNLGGSRFCIDIGATSIDHLDAISDGEIGMLAASETIGVVTPTVNFNFGSAEFAPARKLIDMGCAIALSTDYNPGSAPCPSIPNAMAIGCRYQKILPAEAFAAATVNAAYAVGLGTKTGSIEIGKWADIVIFDTRDYREVAYEFGDNPVAAVFKSGKQVV